MKVNINSPPFTWINIVIYSKDWCQKNEKGYHKIDAESLKLIFFQLYMKRNLTNTRIGV
jgi:hypothetical protein